MNEHRRSPCRICLAILAGLTFGFQSRLFAQMPVVVRGVAASLGGDSPVLTTGTAGGGVGVELSDYLEVFGEFTQSLGTTYPPSASSAVAASGGPPVSVEILVLEWSRHDQLLVSGGRLGTSRTRRVWAFTEAGGGLARRHEVLRGVRGLETWTDQLPLFIVGGGVAGRAGHLELEGGYRAALTGGESASGRLNEFRVAAGLRFTSVK